MQKDGGETSGCESDSHHCGQCDVLQIEAGEGILEEFENRTSFFAGLFAEFELDRAVVEVFQKENSLQQIL